MLLTLKWYLHYYIYIFYLFKYFQSEGKVVVKNQTPEVRQAPYCPDIRRYLQKCHNEVRCSSRSIIFYENSTRALNTVSLKCCLPSTDAIDRGETIHI